MEEGTLLTSVAVMVSIFLSSADVGSPPHPGSLLETEESIFFQFVGDALRKRLLGNIRI